MDAYKEHNVDCHLKGRVMRMMNRVVAILMERDGNTEQEAVDRINECRDAMLESGDEDEIMYHLGLEPDYIMDVLFV